MLSSLSSLLPDVLLLVVHGKGLPPCVPDTRHLLGLLLHLLVLRSYCLERSGEHLLEHVGLGLLVASPLLSLLPPAQHHQQRGQREGEREHWQTNLAQGSGQ